MRPAWCSCQDSLVSVPRHLVTAWCSCQDMLARLVFGPKYLALVPRHAGQPGARAKTCWPAWCWCQDMLASMALCPRHAGVRPKTPGASLVTTCWSAVVRAKTCWLGWCSGQGTWCSCQEMLASLVLGGALTLWFSHQDMLASPLVPRHAGQHGETCCQPGGCAKTSVLQPAWCSCPGMWACLNLVPRDKTCGQPGVCSKTCQPGVRAKTYTQPGARAKTVLAHTRPAWCAFAKTCGQPGGQRPDMRPPGRSCQDMRPRDTCGQPGVRAKTAWCPCQDTWSQPGVRAKTCWLGRCSGQSTWRSCQDMLASLVLLPRASLVLVPTHAGLVLVPRHAGQHGAHAKTCWRAKTRSGQTGACAKTCWPACLFLPRHAASLVAVPRHAGQPDVAASLAFVPRHVGLPEPRASCQDMWPAGCRAKTCEPGVRAKTYTQPAARAKTVLAHMRPAWVCVCQDMQPAWSKTCGQPPRAKTWVCAKTCWPAWCSGQTSACC